MKRYRLSPRASDDSQALYIQGHDLFGSRQADIYYDGLKAALSRLAEYPGLGRSREDLGPGLRSLPFKAHIVLYRPDADGVFILRIRHAHEDWISDPLGSADSEEDPS